jgi:hypothetical protein
MSMFSEEDLAGLSEAEREALRDLAEDDQDLQPPAVSLVKPARLPLLQRPKKTRARLLQEPRGCPTGRRGGRCRPWRRRHSGRRGSWRQGRGRG